MSFLSNECEGGRRNRRPVEGRVFRAQDGPATKKLSSGFSAVLLVVLGLGASCWMGELSAQIGVGLDITVEMEPGQQFAPGWILSAPRFSSNLTYPLVIDEAGVARHNQLRPFEGFNFDLHENGTVAWFSTLEGWWHELDSSLLVSDIIEFVGADVDFHDLELRANGTSLLMGSEIITMNVADSVPDPDDPSRAVIDCILQELDENGNIIWAWRASDHIPATFCSHCNWEASLIDAYHHNAFETQDNGDILLCMRNMDLVVRIDRASGGLAWQMGGPESNFTFTDATGAFAQQHDAQLLPGNRMIVFDNATGSEPLTSRGVEYQLDYDNWTATVVETWPHPDGNFAGSQGSIQRLEDGGTLIGWGTAGSDEYNGGMVSEYSASGALLGTIYFPANYWNYRARKVPADALPLRIGCRNTAACNYDQLAVVDGECLFVGSPCDDGDPCTVQDAVNNQCECVGEFPFADPEDDQCLDPMALNYNPCSTLPFDDGSCQYLLEFRVDATQWGTVPGSVGLAWLDLPTLTFEAGGFGTWTGSLVVGNGIWTYGFKADGQPDGVQRTLDLTWPVDWDGEVIRACLGQAAAFCSGCTDPDDPGFSPFAGDDTFCGLGNGVGCTLAGADNFEPDAFFDDGSCAFSPAEDCQPDLNDDGLIGVADVLELLTYFGVFCE